MSTPQVEHLIKGAALCSGCSCMCCFWPAADVKTTPQVAHWIKGVLDLVNSCSGCSAMCSTAAALEVNSTPQVAHLIKIFSLPWSWAWSCLAIGVVWQPNTNNAATKIAARISLDIFVPPLELLKFKNAFPGRWNSFAGLALGSFITSS